MMWPVQSAQFAEGSKRTQWTEAESEEEDFESEEGEEQAMEGEEQAQEEEEQAQEGDKLAPSLQTRCEQQSLTMSLSMAWQWLKQD